MNKRAGFLADRIEQGAATLGSFAEGLNDAEWRTVVPGDGRTVGVTVHHVANMYPIEVQLAQVLAAGKPIEGVTWAAVADINAKHAQEHASVTKAEAATPCTRWRARSPRSRSTTAASPSTR